MAKAITKDPYVPYQPNTPNANAHGGHGGTIPYGTAGGAIGNGIAGAPNPALGSTLTGAATGAANSLNSIKNTTNNYGGGGGGSAVANTGGDMSGISSLYDAIISGLSSQLSEANKLAQGRREAADALAKDQLYQNNRQTVNQNNHMRKLYDERYGGDMAGAAITNRGRIAANLANNLAGNRRNYTSVLQNNLNDYYSALAQNQNIYNQGLWNYAVSPLTDLAKGALNNGYGDLYREIVDKIRR